ncbi:MAG: hypothetical protein WCE62_22025 [Polyangiales bacterium]
MRPIPVTKASARFVADPARTITKPFMPGGDLPVDERSRVERFVLSLRAIGEGHISSIEFR